MKSIKTQRMRSLKSNQKLSLKVSVTANDSKSCDTVGGILKILGELKRSTLSACNNWYFISHGKSIKLCQHFPVTIKELFLCAFPTVAVSIWSAAALQFNNKHLVKGISTRTRHYKHALWRVSSFYDLLHDTFHLWLRLGEPLRIS